MASVVVSALGVSAGTVGAALIEIGVGVAVSRVGQVIAERRAAANRRGLVTDYTTGGAMVPQSILLGRMATRGHFVCPHYAHGGGNSHRVQVIQLSSAPVAGLVGVWVGDQFYNLADMVEDGPGGLTPPSGADHHKKFWITWFDGRQTAACQYLVDFYGGHPSRPWSASAVGVGNAYAVCTFAAGEPYQGEPEVRFLVRGLRLLDPRTGAKEFTNNGAVIAWNILRGVEMPDGSLFGFGVPDDRLPSAEFVAAMDDQDARNWTISAEVFIGTAESGGESPMDVLERIAAACDLQFVEVAGEWRVRSGPVGLPLAVFGDDDLTLEGSEVLEPIPAADEHFNAVRVSYLSPSAGWEMDEGAVKYDRPQIALDGGVVRVGEVSLPMVTRSGHASALARAWLADAARRRRHSLPVGVGLSHLRPLDCVVFASARNGYDGKMFEVAEVAIDADTMAATVALREVDPDDWAADPADGVGASPPPPSELQAVAASAGAVAGFAAVGGVTAAGRAAVFASWSVEAMTFKAVQVEVRPVGGVDLAASVTVAASAGAAVIGAGLDFAAGYEVRARGLDRATAWSPWAAVQTGSAPGRSVIDPGAGAHGYQSGKPRIGPIVTAGAAAVGDCWRWSIAADGLIYEDAGGAQIAPHVFFEVRVTVSGVVSDWRSLADLAAWPVGALGMLSAAGLWSGRADLVEFRVALRFDVDPAISDPAAVAPPVMVDDVLAVVERL